VQARTLAPGEKVRVAVDYGGVGVSVVDALRDRSDPLIELYPVMFGGKSHWPREFQTMRDQLWFTLRDWLKGGGAIPEDEMLIQELIASEVDRNRVGEQKVEPKDQVKTRLGRSPDRGDALCLGVHTAQASDLVYGSA
jgi:hypothetical protein